MNNLLAGTAAAAAVVATAAAAWLLFAPPSWRSGPPAAMPAGAESADSTALPAAGAIERHGRGLAAQAGAPAWLGMQETLPRPRQGFLLTYGSNSGPNSGPNDRVDDRTGAGGAPAAPAGAAERAAWQARFCTAQLRSLLRAERVEVATGRVVDGAGNTRYATDCLPETAQSMATTLQQMNRQPMQEAAGVGQPAAAAQPPSSTAASAAAEGTAARPPEQVGPAGPLL